MCSESEAEHMILIKQEPIVDEKCDSSDFANLKPLIPPYLEPPLDLNPAIPSQSFPEQKRLVMQKDPISGRNLLMLSSESFPSTYFVPSFASTSNFAPNFAATSNVAPNFLSEVENFRKILCEKFSPQFAKTPARLIPALYDILHCRVPIATAARQRGLNGKARDLKGRANGCGKVGFELGEELRRVFSKNSHRVKYLPVRNFSATSALEKKNTGISSGPRAEIL